MAIVIVIAAAAVSPPVSNRLGYEPPFDLAAYFEGSSDLSSRRFEVFPGGPGITVEGPLYAPRDPWKRWLADESTCPGGERTDGSPQVQTQVMLCLVNYARRQQGLRPLAVSRHLNASAAAKAADIVRCDEFAHDACGKVPNQVALDVGYEGAFGENIYMAEGRLVAPRVALDRWLNSPGHRENLFRARWRTTGIALLGNANVEAVDDGVV